MKVDMIRGMEVLALLWLSVAWGQTAPHATLTVDLRQPCPSISPTLYGIGLDEQYHSGDGGLYAELVRNRSFEDGPTPLPWQLITGPGATGSMDLDTGQPAGSGVPAPGGAAQKTHALRVTAKSAGPGRVGIANEGYWGISVVTGERYDLSLVARRDETFSGSLAATLEGPAGKVCGEGRVESLTTTWQRHRCVLTASSTEPRARLVLAVSRPGAVWLDAVSLMPQRTWAGKAQGLRADLARMLADLGPAFVRLPGGDHVAGDRLANAWRWKATLGDWAVRPGHWTPARYRATDGLGYLEYLQFCADLKAAPWLVVSCGMAQGETAPLDRLAPWAEEAVEALDYANGGADAPWGRRRARDGHPAAFGVAWVEVGNRNGGLTYSQHKNFASGEHGGAQYEGRFPVFSEAIKTRHPGVAVMANGFLKDSAPDWVDEQIQADPEWLVSSATRYDDYDRQGPHIALGAYACAVGAGKGNLRAALSEAAFMTGLERNGDVVGMAAYGPLLVNANVPAESPGAVRFNAAASYGTPSYYVQQLFSRHRGQTVLPVRIDSSVRSPNARGGIGLGTWRTRAEFKDIVVTGPEGRLYESDFTQGVGDWKAVVGRWTAQGGAYRQDAQEEFLHATLSRPGWTDYTLSLKARKLGGEEGFQVRFRMREDGSCYWWNLGGWRNHCHGVEKTAGATWPLVGVWPILLSRRVEGQIETGRWYDVRIEVRGSRIRCLLDGQLVHDCVDPTLEPLLAVAGRTAKTGAGGGGVVLKVVNLSGEPRDTQVALEGAGRVEPQGTVTVLAGGSLEEENSFPAPNRIVPVVRELGGMGASFRHTFPPYSLSILCLEAR